MCGLAGVLGGSECADDRRAVAERMAATLAHRGPDDCASSVDERGPFAIDVRRLAVVDRSAAGGQPLKAPGGRYVTTLNGEIYNHAELRATLSRAGYHFRGDLQPSAFRLAARVRAARPRRQGRHADRPATGPSPAT